eukprot:2490602-Rhodomonas_salina.1
MYSALASQARHCCTSCTYSPLSVSTSSKPSGQETSLYAPEDVLFQSPTRGIISPLTLQERLALFRAQYSPGHWAPSGQVMHWYCAPTPTG